MLESTLRVLAPPAGGRYEVIACERQGDRLIAGFLRCPTSGAVVPVAFGFALFTEPWPEHAPLDGAALAQAAVRWFGDPDAYAEFFAAKRRRPTFDPYAAFAPFNEAHRAMQPILRLLRERLAPGAIVVDLHCRSGWTAELLAASLPDQQVIALWEGNRDILGYRGFGHWLGPGQRLPNLDILFVPADAPLPFADDSVALVHGHDLLHGRDPVALVGEALRIAADSGAVVFSHVHLSNGPGPGFVRGGHHRHGRDYHQLLGPLLGDKRLFVLSELDLFEANETRLIDAADTDHYNGVLVIAEPSLAGQELDSSRDPIGADDRLIVNPLIGIDWTDRTVRVAPEALGGHGRELLERHECYRGRLEQRAPGCLSWLETKVLYWAGRGLTVGEMATRLADDPAVIAAAAGGLADRELVLPVRCSEAMWRLQHYFATQEVLVPRRRQALAALWQTAVRRFAGHTYLIADAEDAGAERYSYAEAGAIVERMGCRLAAAGVGAGSRIGLIAAARVEAVLLVWAILNRGAVVVVIDPSLGRDVAAARLVGLGARLVFHDGAALPLRADVAQIQIGDAVGSGDDGVLELSDWLDGDAEEPDAGPASVDDAIDPDADAVVLFTSGTAGRPKAVALSHGSLFRTSRLLAEVTDWSGADVVHCPGGLYAMSGLRNPVFATAQVGAAAVLRETPAVVSSRLGRLIEDHAITVLSVVPAIVEHLAVAGTPAVGRLRLVLSTAGPLSPVLAARFRDRYGVPLRDYYGLTETGGICVLSDAGSSGPDGGIGRPVGVIADVIDAAGAPCPRGIEGELRIYSDNLMRGYLDDASGTGLIQDETYSVRTGDRARIDVDGTVHLLGRRRRVVKHSSGDAVALATVERVLLELAGVERATATIVHEGVTGRERLEVTVEAGPGVSADALRSCLTMQLGRAADPARIELREVGTPASDGRS